MLGYRLAFAFVSTSVLSGCALPNLATKQDTGSIQLASYEQRPAKTVYVVGHGWHTGVVLRSSDISPDVFPEIRGFWNTDFVEFGWGDEGFYRAEKINVPLVARAAFWPTPSVLHVAGFRGSVEQFFQTSDIVEVTLSQEQFDNLCRFVRSSFDRTETGQVMPLGPGLYGDSTFFRAQGSYYLPKTCNTWTANALKAAGCPVLPQTAIFAENMLSQTQKFGRVLQESPRGLKKLALLSDQ